MWSFIPYGTYCKGSVSSTCDPSSPMRHKASVSSTCGSSSPIGHKASLSSTCCLSSPIGQKASVSSLHHINGSMLCFFLKHFDFLRLWDCRSVAGVYGSLSVQASFFLLTLFTLSPLPFLSSLFSLFFLPYSSLCLFFVLLLGLQPWLPHHTLFVSIACDSEIVLIKGNRRPTILFDSVISDSVGEALLSGLLVFKELGSSVMLTQTQWSQ